MSMYELQEDLRFPLSLSPSLPFLTCFSLERPGKAAPEYLLVQASGMQLLYLSSIPLIAEIGMNITSGRPIVAIVMVMMQ